jgi:hypothetical protein
MSKRVTWGLRLPAPSEIEFGGSLSRNKANPAENPVRRKNTGDDVRPTVSGRETYGCPVATSVRGIELR